MSESANEFTGDEMFAMVVKFIQQGGSDQGKIIKPYNVSVENCGFIYTNQLSWDVKRKYLGAYFFEVLDHVGALYNFSYFIASFESPSTTNRKLKEEGIGKKFFNHLQMVGQFICEIFNVLCDLKKGTLAIGKEFCEGVTENTVRERFSEVTEERFYSIVHEALQRVKEDYPSMKDEK